MALHILCSAAALQTTPCSNPRIASASPSGAPACNWGYGMACASACLQLQWAASLFPDRAHCLPDAAVLTTAALLALPCSVVAKGPGWLKLDRPVPVDLKLEWAVRQRQRSLVCWAVGFIGLAATSGCHRPGQ